MASGRCWWPLKHACVKCREVFTNRTTCNKGHEMTRVANDWAAPRKSNNKAWSLIAKGDWLWDKKRVQRGR